MLVNLRDITAIAEQNSMAIAAFNTPSLEAMRAAVEAAEQSGYPVIIAHAEGHEALCPLDVAAPCMMALAEKSSAQICVHLDHGEDLSYIRRALEYGFSGIMYDGSALPFEQNVANSARAAAMVGMYNCGLECELGSMGTRESGAGHEDEQEHIDPIYTNPDQAAEFIDSTGLDILACSFGTVHGLYKAEPRLNFDVLTQIREQREIPLVMHGGSGVSDEDYHNAIDAGIRKINYYTYGVKYAGEAVRKKIDGFVAKSPDAVVYWDDMTMAAYETMRSTFEQVIRTFANGAKPLA